MVVFEAQPFKRTIVIGLGRGDDVLEAINQAIVKYDIKQGAVISGIGALSKATFHRVSDFEPAANNEFVTVESPIELGSLQGLICDGFPHIHMTFSDIKGNTFAGHLEPGSVVLYIGEIVIVEFDGGDFTRCNDENGLSMLTPLK